MFVVMIRARVIYHSSRSNIFFESATLCVKHGLSVDGLRLFRCDCGMSYACRLIDEDFVERYILVDCIACYRTYHRS